MAKRSGPIGTFIFSIVFCAVGYYVAFKIGKPMLETAKASADWPTIEATILSSEVVTKRKDSKTMYSADINYAYEVENKKYKSNQIRIGGSTSSSNSSGAYDTTDKYPKGAKVEAHYNPDKPAEAVLEAGTTFMTHLPYYVGLLFLVLGAFTLLSLPFRLVFGLSR